jgi:hypothetical protein
MQMPRFRVKNLSISLSERFGDPILIPTPNTWFHCGWPFTCHQFISKCWNWPSCHWFISNYCHWQPSIIECPFHSTIIVDCRAGTEIGCPGASAVFENPEGILINPALEADQLDQMREVLMAALKQVEDRGVMLQEYTKPRTKEQAKAMEEQLNAALEELKRMNKDLE